MNFKKNFKENLFKITSQNFVEEALNLFFYQAKHNKIYQEYLHLLHFNTTKVSKIEDIPFLPIELFKHHTVSTGYFEPERVFESSGTTGQTRSRHYVAEVSFYHQLSKKIFEQFYGNLQDYHILALLPSYLERNHASLVEMVAYFIAESQSSFSGFYLDDFSKLHDTLLHLQEKADRKILLLGVTFGLLDFAEQFPMDLSAITLMETGGMKGRRKELLRSEVHLMLKEAFQVKEVHSEYGMTELLSQAYSIKEEIFETPPWMRIYLRELRDPFCIDNQQRSGAINIIDLANIDSCAFIATQDIGTWESEGRFKVLGRTDVSEIRGCNLMVW
jgi:hypothetical protein